MDPNTTLTRAREKLMDGDWKGAHADLLALDAWICDGGSEPYPSRDELQILVRFARIGVDLIDELSSKEDELQVLIRFAGKIRGFRAAAVLNHLTKEGF